MKLLNLGCGNRFHRDWMNLDFKSNSEYVQEFDLHQELPFEDESVDVVYSSHVLEHFSKCEAPKFLQRCFRVLKKGGIIRVVVPDLEPCNEKLHSIFRWSQEGRSRFSREIRVDYDRTF